MRYWKRLRQGWRKLSFNQRFTLIISLISLSVSLLLGGWVVVQYFITVNSNAATELGEKTRHEEQMQMQKEQAELEELSAALQSQIAILEADQSSALEIQNELQAAVATSEARIADQEAVRQEREQKIREAQLSIEKGQENMLATQVAGDEKLNELYERLAYPYIKVVNGPINAQLRQAVFITETDSISVTGHIDLILSNEGGAQAGLVDIIFNSVEPDASLNIEKVAIDGKEIARFPKNIQGQSAFGFELTFSGQLESPNGLSFDIAQQESQQQSHQESQQEPLQKQYTEFQMGRIWNQSVMQTEPQLLFEFSNTVPLTLPIEGFLLSALPLVSVHPNPPSPFNVTEADVGNLGVITISYAGSSGPEYLDIISSNESAAILLTTEGQFEYSLPKGKYTISASNPAVVISNDSFEVNADSLHNIDVVVLSLIPTRTPFPATTTPTPMAVATETNTPILVYEVELPPEVPDLPGWTQRTQIAYGAAVISVLLFFIIPLLIFSRGKSSTLQVELACGGKVLLSEIHRFGGFRNKKTIYNNRDEKSFSKIEIRRSKQEYNIAIYDTVGDLIEERRYQRIEEREVGEDLRVRFADECELVVTEL